MQSWVGGEAIRRWCGEVVLLLTMQVVNCVVLSQCGGMVIVALCAFVVFKSVWF